MELLYLTKIKLSKLRFFDEEGIANGGELITIPPFFIGGVGCIQNLIIMLVTSVNRQKMPAG